jgi:hypothetical protein
MFVSIAFFLHYFTVADKILSELFLEWTAGGR